MPPTASPVGLLPESMLETFRARAGSYDRENRFFQEDFDDMSAAGYLRMAVPTDFGGLGYSLHQVALETRRLAAYAPATALATNMHHYWVGLAADLWRRGDTSCEWLLREAGAGEVFAAGHAETGNDLPLLLSTSKAERVPRRLRVQRPQVLRQPDAGVDQARRARHGHERPERAEDRPRLHARADSPGISIKETWDVLGMRATRSDDTVLDKVFCPDEYIARVQPAGAAGIDAFVLGIFAWGLLNFGNIYYGLAQRVRDLIVEQVKGKTSLGLTRSMAYHPLVQHGIAEITMELEAIGPQLDAATRDWSDGVDHGGQWPIKIVAAKYRAVEGAWRIVDRAMDLSGGFGMFKKSEMERLFRDARAGRFHPANALLSHELIGKLALGINPDEQPRWG